MLLLFFFVFLHYFLLNEISLLSVNFAVHHFFIPFSFYIARSYQLIRTNTHAVNHQKIINLMNNTTNPLTENTTSVVERNLSVSYREALLILSKIKGYTPASDEEAQDLLLELHQILDELAHGEPI